jgi:hypothetical protein
MRLGPDIDILPFSNSSDPLNRDICFLRDFLRFLRAQVPPYLLEELPGLFPGSLLFAFALPGHDEARSVEAALREDVHPRRRTGSA